MAEYKGAGDTVTINDVLEVCGNILQIKKVLI